jgi:hypothetical protein
MSTAYSQRIAKPHRTLPGRSVRRQSAILACGDLNSMSSGFSNRSSTS